jgi:hypothetical protein
VPRTACRGTASYRCTLWGTQEGPDDLGASSSADRRSGSRPRPRLLGEAPVTSAGASSPSIPAASTPLIRCQVRGGPAGRGDVEMRRAMTRSLTRTIADMTAKASMIVTMTAILSSPFACHVDRFPARRHERGPDGAASRPPGRSAVPRRPRHPPGCPGQPVVITESHTRQPPRTIRRHFCPGRNRLPRRAPTVVCTLARNCKNEGFASPDSSLTVL